MLSHFLIYCIPPYPTSLPFHNKVPMKHFLLYLKKNYFHITESSFNYFTRRQKVICLRPRHCEATFCCKFKQKATLTDHNVEIRQGNPKVLRCNQGMQTSKRPAARSFWEQIIEIITPRKPASSPQGFWSSRYLDRFKFPYSVQPMDYNLQQLRPYTLKSVLSLYKIRFRLNLMRLYKIYQVTYILIQYSIYLTCISDRTHIDFYKSRQHL
jgi:hypothetical protein